MSHPHDFIEILENRIAPAGLVGATFDPATGLLTLAGDLDDNVVNLFSTGPNSYRIEGGATDIGTVGNPFSDFTGNLKSVVINAGPGNDNFTLNNLLALKDLTFNGQAGGDSLTTFNIKTSGAVNVNFGADGGSAALDGVTTVGGDLTVNYGNDGGSVSIFGTTATVKGTVDLNGGAGPDTFDFSSNTLNVGKGVVFLAGEGTNQAIFESVNTTIGKRATGNAVEFTSGSGSDTFDVRGSTAKLKGNVVVGTGDGANAVDFNPATLKLDGLLTVTGGAGTDVVHLFGGTSTIKGAVNVNVGDGAANLVEIRPTVNLSLGSSLTLTGGALDDSFLISGGPSVVVKGAVLMDVGDGGVGVGNSVALNSTVLTIGSSLTVKGAATSAMNVGAAATFLNVKGLVDIQTGAGDSLVQLDSDEASFGSLNVKTAGGADFVQIRGSTLKLGGAATVATGAAVDLIDVSFNTVAIKGAVNILSGADSDIVSFSADGSVTGDFALDLGGGDDGSSFADLGGNSGIAGNLKIGGKLTILSATTDTGVLGNAEFISVKDVTVGKAILIDLGVVDSTLTIDNLIAKDTFTIETDAGIDEVNIEQAGFIGASVFSKIVAIDLGAGNDIFRLGLSSATGSSSFARFLAAMSVDGGADTDASNDFLNAGTNFFATGVAKTRTNFEGAFI